MNQFQVSKQLDYIIKRARPANAPDRHRRHVGFTFPSIATHLTKFPLPSTAHPIAKESPLIIPRHHDITDDQWDGMRRVVAGLTLPDAWNDITYDLDRSRLISSSNYPEQHQANGQSVMVRSNEVTTINVTRISHILPSTPPRIFAFDLTEELRNALVWSTFVAEYGHLTGRVSIFRSKIDSRVSQYIARGGNVPYITVQQFDQTYLQPYLLKMEKMEDEIIEIPYLMDVSGVPASFYTMMRKLSPIIGECDHDGSQTLNWFINRSFPKRTQPNVDGMFYINAPTNGGVGTPFHRGK